MSADANPNGTLHPDGSVIVADARPRMTQRELYLETLRHDPTNSAAYDYLAMMADEADPIAYFAQVAAVAAEEEACEGMQAPLPPLWPRVLHLLADLKLPPDSVPGALIPRRVILRALRSSNEQLQTLGLMALVRFTENSYYAAQLPLEVLTWLGRVLWCSESMPSLVQAVKIIRLLADVPSSFSAPLLHAVPPVVPRLVMFITSERAELMELAMSALMQLTAFTDSEAQRELVELGVLEAAESHLQASNADPTSVSIGMAAQCASVLYGRAPTSRVISFVRVLTKHLARLTGNTTPASNRTAKALFASIRSVVTHRAKDDDAAILKEVLQREVRPVALLFNGNDELAWSVNAVLLTLPRQPSAVATRRSLATGTENIPSSG
jgi:hypothetical protein